MKSRKNIMLAALCSITLLAVGVVIYLSRGSNVDFIKNQPSPDPSLTVGMLLDGYNGFSNKKWENFHDDHQRNLTRFSGIISSIEIDGTKDLGQNRMKEVAELYDKANKLSLAGGASISTADLLLNKKIVDAKEYAYALFDSTQKGNNSAKSTTGCYLEVYFAINANRDGFTIKDIFLKYSLLNDKKISFSQVDRSELFKVLSENKSLSNLLFNALCTKEAPDFRHEHQ